MKHISFRLVFTALCTALVLAFVLVITGVFFRNIRQFETGRAAAYLIEKVKEKLMY